MEEHPHDATCVKEEWDEFLEIYVHLVKNICMYAPSLYCYIMHSLRHWHDAHCVVRTGSRGPWATHT